MSWDMAPKNPREVLCFNWLYYTLERGRLKGGETRFRAFSQTIYNLIIFLFSVFCIFVQDEDSRLHCRCNRDDPDRRFRVG